MFLENVLNFMLTDYECLNKIHRQTYKNILIKLLLNNLNLLQEEQHVGMDFPVLFL